MARINKNTDSVAAMFNSIAARYDFLNHFLSLGIDKFWRKQLVREVFRHNPKIVLDVATGTGDLAIAIAKKSSEIDVVGVDIAPNMLEIARKKVADIDLDKRISLVLGSALNLPFPNNNFDAVIVAFGVRNFENLSLGLKEIFRVLKPGGVFCVLEFSVPRSQPFSALYKWYFRHLLPFLGGLISGNRNAYTYLPDSVLSFPEGKQFTDILSDVGFQNVSFKRLTFGVASIYIAHKI